MAPSVKRHGMCALCCVLFKTLSFVDTLRNLFGMMSHQQGSTVSDGGFQMSNPPVEESLTTQSVPEHANEAEVMDEDDDYEVPHEKSNQTDPERRAREFRARHIQMMALGTFLEE